MSSLKTKAIVLGNINLKEKDKLVDLFTLEYGRMAVSMKGVRGEKAKLKMAKEPFCFGEFVVENTKGNNIVTQVDIVDNFYDLTKDINKFYEGCALLDIIKNVATAQCESEIFIETLKALKTLCYENVKKYYVFDKFLIKLTEILGYSFINEKCSSCGATMKIVYFDLTKGMFVCPNCKTEASFKVGLDAFKGIDNLSQTQYEKLPTLNLPANAEKEILKILALNLEWRAGLKILKIN